MLRIIQNSTAVGAKTYYSTADYYTEGHELVGNWRGKGAARLGLHGEIDKGDWDALCDNKDPRTGCSLTARQREGRRVGYDFNFHVPKSVSLLYGLTEDPRLLEAFKDAVGSTMEDMEAEMQTRIRSDGRNEDRTTGNMVWGEFVHTTARPVGGIPDPHLHAHCFVFNATWDHDESRWKAGQFAGLKRDAPYFEAVFHARLARNMAEIGLDTRRTRQGWELAGLDEATLAKFSRRTAQIEAKAIEKGIIGPDEKGELGAKTRSGKANELPYRVLQRLWKSWLSPDEQATLQRLVQRIGSQPIAEDKDRAAEATDWAIDHCFERDAVVPERMLLREALKSAYGAASAETVLREAQQRPLLRAERQGRNVVTTQEILAEEREMIRFARDGRGTLSPIADGPHRLTRKWLGEDQRKAVEHVLGSRDRVTVIRGAAGTGKTSMMQEAAEAIEQAGHKVFTFAPSADASRGVLRQVGFANADTVARLLIDEKLQAKVKDQVIWVDEAGLLSSRTTAALFRMADRQHARLILSGDRRQHASVERGSPLRLLEEEAGLVPAELREIHRQADRYKRAIWSLSQGRTKAGFTELDDLGWVREVADADRYKQLAADYVQTVREGKTALCVSPTHLEGEWITDEVRAELKQLGRLGKKERRLEVLKNLNLTEAQRRDEVNYQPGDVLVFHQNARGHTKGDRITVGKEPLPFTQAERFQLYKRDSIDVAPGDILRITSGGTTADGKHALRTGTLHTVRGFDKAGNILLTNNWTIDRKFGHIAHGYAVTSHSSQGKSVERVFIGQSAQSWPASSREQFYVSASRGERQVVIYTDDKAGLLDAVSRSDERTTATDLVRIGAREPNRDYTLQHRQHERSEEKVRG